MLRPLPQKQFAACSCTFTVPASAFLPPLSLVVDTKTGVLYLTSDELFDMLRAMPPRLARVCARQWTAGRVLLCTSERMEDENPTQRGNPACAQ